MAVKNLGKATGIKSALANIPAGTSTGNDTLVVNEKVRDVHLQLNMLEATLTTLEQILSKLYEQLIPVIVENKTSDTRKPAGVATMQNTSPIGSRIMENRLTVEQMIRDVDTIMSELQI